VIQLIAFERRTKTPSGQLVLGAQLEVEKRTAARSSFSVRVPGRQLVSTSTRLLEKILESVGAGSETLKAFGHPETNILGESFYSKAPIRYGAYIANSAFSRHPTI
jgi:hypothetical protein